RPEVRNHLLPPGNGKLESLPLAFEFRFAHITMPFFHLKPAEPSSTSTAILPQSNDYRLSMVFKALGTSRLWVGQYDKHIALKKTKKRLFYIVILVVVVARFKFMWNIMGFLASNSESGILTGSSLNIHPPTGP
ncbi:hypothetical protein MAR_016345, partial [Mya arenaria]